MLSVVILGFLNLILAYVAFHVTVHPIGKKTKKWKIVALKCAIVACCLLALILNAVQYKVSEKTASKNASKITDLLDQVGGLSNQLTQSVQENKDQFQKLTTDFSTNSEISSVVRIGILKDEIVQKSNEVNSLLKEYKIILSEPQNMETMRQERENLLAQQNNKDKSSLLQKQIDDINAQKQASLDAETQRENQQKKEQEGLLALKNISDTTLPVFNAVIANLSRRLEAFANDYKLNSTGSFPSDPPTIYSSHMVTNGLLISGTDFIGLGTNLEWRCVFSTFGVQIGRSAYRFNKARIRMTVTSGDTNDDSLLTIQPFWANKQVPKMPGSVAGADTFSLTLTVPGGDTNGLNLDEGVPFTNSTAAIDEAVRHLIESRDQSSPIPKAH